MTPKGGRQKSGREGGRSLKTRVKTARKRSLASTLWLERQLNDPYVARARLEGFRSRAAFKLIEIDDALRASEQRTEWTPTAAARLSEIKDSLRRRTQADGE